MAFELIYTSSPEGIRQGSTGFCTVACTRGIDSRLMQTMEGLSAYKPIFPHYDEKACRNPVAYSHYITSGLQGTAQHILTRACYNGVDHTGRSNKLVSHLALRSAELQQAAGGPASLFFEPGLFKEADWSIHNEIFPYQKDIPSTEGKAGKCLEWERAMGDAGWGGVLAQHALNGFKGNVYLIYEPLQDVNVLSLIHEAISLLPEDLRWKVTFSTYFTTLLAGVECSWRGCTPDSPALIAARRSPANIFVDLTKPCKISEDTPMIRAARGETGTILLQTPKKVEENVETAEDNEIVEEEIVEEQEDNQGTQQRVEENVRPKGKVSQIHIKEGRKSTAGREGCAIYCLGGLLIIILLCAIYLLVWSAQKNNSKALENSKSGVIRQEKGLTSEAKTGALEGRKALDEQEKEIKKIDEQEPVSEKKSEEYRLDVPEETWLRYRELHELKNGQSLSLHLPRDLMLKDIEIYHAESLPLSGTRKVLIEKGNVFSIYDEYGRTLTYGIDMNQGIFTLTKKSEGALPGQRSLAILNKKQDILYPFFFNNDSGYLAPRLRYDIKENLFVLRINNPYKEYRFMKNMPIGLFREGQKVSEEQVIDLQQNTILLRMRHPEIEKLLKQIEHEKRNREQLQKDGRKIAGTIKQQEGESKANKSKKTSRRDTKKEDVQNQEEQSQLNSKLDEIKERYRQSSQKIDSLNKELQEKGRSFSGMKVELMLNVGFNLEIFVANLSCQVELNENK